MRPAASAVGAGAAAAARPAWETFAGSGLSALAEKSVSASVVEAEVAGPGRVDLGKSMARLLGVRSGEAVVC